MPFLLNYTNPKTNSISACYQSAQDMGRGIFEDDSAVETLRYQSEAPEDAGAVDDSWLSGWTQAFENPLLFGNSEEQWWDEIIYAQHSSCRALNMGKGHAQAIASQVARDLAALCRSQCSEAGDGPSFDEDAFRSLFTLDNMVEFCELYFACWSPHCPILHRPTFDLTKVYPPLLLAVFLIGQAYSSELDVSQAQAHYDLAEAYAFSHPKFKQLLQDNLPLSSAPSASLEPIQAAYLMVLVQMCGKSSLSRRRVRRSRYNDVIQAARSLRLFDSKNEFLDLEQRDCVDFDWHGFVAKESRIRLAYLIFGIECNFAMFHEHYPRLAVSEMTGDPMCSESCFSAPSRASCEQYAKKEMRSNTLAISTCVLQLLESQVNISIQSSLAGLSPMNFFFVLCGLHCAIHASRANGTGKILYPAMTRALNRWIRIWESQMRNFPLEERKKIGFMRDAGPEFWQLACIFVEAENRGLLNTELLRSMDVDRMENVCHLLEAFRQTA
ncbi:Fungal specific transcription factor domain-containing protein [Cladophialophora immunda]|nr:Fungal specific transcription factor domain-containing protein [Cladophialophora immunda]